MLYLKQLTSDYEKDKLYRFINNYLTSQDAPVTQTIGLDEYDGALYNSVNEFVDTWAMYYLLDYSPYNITQFSSFSEMVCVSYAIIFSLQILGEMDAKDLRIIIEGFVYTIYYGEPFYRIRDRIPNRLWVTLSNSLYDAYYGDSEFSKQYREAYKGYPVEEYFCECGNQKGTFLINVLYHVEYILSKVYPINLDISCQNGYYTLEDFSVQYGWFCAKEELG